MKIRECMKSKVYSISDTTTIRDAAKMFKDKHIGSLPVIDAETHLVGLLRLQDLLDLVLPDFINLIDDFDFAADFGVVEVRVPSEEVLNSPVSSIMHSPVSVEVECGLLRAFSLLYKYKLHDLPVVDEDKKLVGIASRVDIGTAFITNWAVTQGGGS